MGRPSCNIGKRGRNKIRTARTNIDGLRYSEHSNGEPLDDLNDQVKDYHGENLYIDLLRVDNALIIHYQSKGKS